MDQLRNDSQRKAESTSAHRVALGQQQELEPESLEQQLKSNEACGYKRGTIGVLSQAIEGARLRKWEISRECFNLVCFALGLFGAVALLVGGYGVRWHSSTSSLAIAKKQDKHEGGEGGSKMNATYIQKPVSFPSVRCFNCRMFWFLRHGARTYPAPTRRLLESLTDQPASAISSHSSLSKAMVAARGAPRCSLLLRDERFRRSCSAKRTGRPCSAETARCSGPVS